MTATDCPLRSAREGLTESIEEQGSVGEPRQQVVVGQPAHVHLKLCLGLAQAALFERLVHRHAEARQSVLQEVVRGPLLDAGDRGLLADRSRDHDQRNAQLTFTQDLEGARRTEPGQRVVAQDQVDRSGQGGQVSCLIFDPLPTYRVAGMLQLADEQVGVFREVLDNHQAEGPQRGGLGQSDRHRAGC
jgi:hypothetical protein